MKSALFFFSVIGVLVMGLAACGPAPTPIVIVVTATSAPIPPAITSAPGLPATIAVAPTLTRLPVLPSVTPLPPNIPATPTNPPAVAQPSTQPLPLQPSATPVLPQLSVFDQGGGTMDVFMFGPPVAKTFLVFRAVVCNPNCKNRADGTDVTSVKFTFYRLTSQGQENKVYEHTESSAPYCSFGGSNVCDQMNISDRNAKWPGTNTVIENSDYVLRVTASGKNNGAWAGSFKFKVQR